MTSIFDRFPDPRGAKNPLFTCRLGTWTRPDFLPRFCLDTPELITEALPGEEIFEWSDLLEAAAAAGDTFTFLEIGAGYGRWSSRAAAAAKHLGKRARVGLAEAEPQHVAWLRQHMTDNGVTDYRVFDASVAGKSGETLFLVGQPPGVDPASNNAREWYGQSAYWSRAGSAVIGDYFGQPLLELEDGWRAVRVPQITLSQVLDHYDFVDLIDFDSQGSEADAVEEAIDVLSRKVRRLHIGTHGPEIEERLVATLSKAAWLCMRRFDCLKEQETTWGLVQFGDGVQTWVNPRV
jgi:FkbM family methyltransferase